MSAYLDHITAHLEVDTSKTVTDYPYGRNRGYVKGKLYYHRKDGEEITEEDIAALQGYRRGQGHGVIKLEGNKIALVQYTCDSGG